MNVWSMEEPSAIQDSQRESMKDQYSPSVHDLRLDPIRVEADLMMLDGIQQPKTKRMVTKDDDSMDSFDSDGQLPLEQQLITTTQARNFADELWNRGCDSAAVVRIPPTSALSSEEYQLRFNRARDEMFEHLKNRLQAKCGSIHGSILSSDSTSIPLNTNSSIGTASHIQQTAKALEHLLYRQCQRNIKVYQDRGTLDARLRGLMMILVRRRMVKRTRQFKSTNGSSSSGMPSTVKKSTLPSSSGSRSHIVEIEGSTTTTSSFITRPGTTRRDLLVTILGEAKYKEIKDLLYEIRLVKMKKVATFCTTQRCASSSLRLYSASGGGAPKTFDQQLPKVVRQLYFETPLVDCFEKYPFEKLTHLPWQDLINQAQGNLLAYQLWELQLNESTTSSNGG